MNKTTYLGIAFAACSMFGIACTARELVESSGDSANADSNAMAGSPVCDAVEDYNVTPPSGFTPSTDAPAEVRGWAMTMNGAPISVFTAQGVGQVYVVDGTTEVELFDSHGTYLAMATRAPDGTLTWSFDKMNPLDCTDDQGSGYSGSSSSGSGYSGSSSSGSDWSASSSSGH